VTGAANNAGTYFTTMNWFTCGARILFASAYLHLMYTHCTFCPHTITDGDAASGRQKKERRGSFVVGAPASSPGE